MTSNRFAFHDEMREIELVRLVVRLCMCVCVCVCATWTADLLTQHAAQAKRQEQEDKARAKAEVAAREAGYSEEVIKNMKIDRNVRR